MESLNRKEMPSRLNTKGCCFLCLASSGNLADGAEVTLNSVSLQSLIRHLQIVPRSVSGLPQNFLSDEGNEEINVDFCESCKLMNSRLSVLFQQLLKVQLEIDYFLKRIHSCITTSAKDPQLVQNYSKRMTSDVETLVQLAFVDNLRKEVASRSLTKQTCLIPVISLKKVTVSQPQRSTREDNFDGFIRTNIKAEVDNNESVDEGCVTPTYSDHTFEMESPSSPTESADQQKNFTNHETGASPPVESSIVHEDRKEGGGDLSKKRKPLMKKKKSSVKKVKKIKIKEKVKVSKFCEKDSVTGWFCCRKCDKRARHSSSIRFHYKTIHLKEKWKCDICNVAIFTQSSHLNFHKKTCQEKLEKKLALEKDPNFKFACDVCGKRFDQEQKLQSHRVRVHESDYRHQCDFCDKKCKRKVELNAHRDAVHLGKTFNCPLCNTRYRREYNLRVHQRKCKTKFNDPN